MAHDENCSKTKLKLLEAAHELMLAKGYTATSLDEICQRAKVTKGSFFHYFKNKEDLAKEVLERYCKAANAKICEYVDAGNQKDPLKRVYRYMAFVSETGPDTGCLIGTLAQELSDTHPEIRLLCEEGFEQWIKMLTKDLEAARKKYIPSARFDAKSLAQYFVVVMEGAQTMAKAKRDPKVIKQSMGHFQKYLEIYFK